MGKGFVCGDEERKERGGDEIGRMGVRDMEMGKWLVYGEGR